MLVHLQCDVIRSEQLFVELVEPVLRARVHEQVADGDHCSTEQPRVLGDEQLDGLPVRSRERVEVGALLVVELSGRRHTRHAPSRASATRSAIQSSAPLGSRDRLVDARPSRDGPSQDSRPLRRSEMSRRRSWTGRLESARAQRNTSFESTVLAKRKSSSSISSSSATAASPRRRRRVARRELSRAHPTEKRLLGLELLGPELHELQRELGELVQHGQQVVCVHGDDRTLDDAQRRWHDSAENRSTITARLAFCGTISSVMA